jgi:hypothetical protein
MEPSPEEILSSPVAVPETVRKSRLQQIKELEAIRMNQGLPRDPVTKWDMIQPPEAKAATPVLELPPTQSE